MKSCISTYSFERLYQDGGFTRFNAIDKTKEYGCQGVELVLNDETPDGSTLWSMRRHCVHMQRSRDWRFQSTRRERIFS